MIQKEEKSCAASQSMPIIQNIYLVASISSASVLDQMKCRNLVGEEKKCCRRAEWQSGRSFNRKRNVMIMFSSKID